MLVLDGQAVLGGGLKCSVFRDESNGPWLHSHPDVFGSAIFEPKCSVDLSATSKSPGPSLGELISSDTKSFQQWMQWCFWLMLQSTGDFSAT